MAELKGLSFMLLHEDNELEKLIALRGGNVSSKMEENSGESVVVINGVASSLTETETLLGTKASNGTKHVGKKFIASLGSDSLLEDYASSPLEGFRFYIPQKSVVTEVKGFLKKNGGVLTDVPFPGIIVILSEAGEKILTKTLLHLNVTTMLLTTSRWIDKMKESNCFLPLLQSEIIEHLDFPSICDYPFVSKFRYFIVADDEEMIDDSEAVANQITLWLQRAHAEVVTDIRQCHLVIAGDIIRKSYPHKEVIQFCCLEHVGFTERPHRHDWGHVPIYVAPSSMEPLSGKKLVFDLPGSKKHKLVKVAAMLGGDILSTRDPHAKNVKYITEGVNVSAKVAGYIESGSETVLFPTYILDLASMGFANEDDYVIPSNHKVSIRRKSLSSGQQEMVHSNSTYYSNCTPDVASLEISSQHDMLYRIKITSFRGSDQVHSLELNNASFEMLPIHEEPIPERDFSFEDLKWLDLKVLESCENSLPDITSFVLKYMAFWFEELGLEIHMKLQLKMADKKSESDFKLLAEIPGWLKPGYGLVSIFPLSSANIRNNIVIAGIYLAKQDTAHIWLNEALEKGLAMFRSMGLGCCSIRKDSNIACIVAIRSENAVPIEALHFEVQDDDDKGCFVSFYMEQCVSGLFKGSILPSGAAHPQIIVTCGEKCACTLVNEDYKKTCSSAAKRIFVTHDSARLFDTGTPLLIASKRNGWKYKIRISNVEGDIDKIDCETIKGLLRECDDSLARNRYSFKLLCKVCDKEAFMKSTLVWTPWVNRKCQQPLCTQLLNYVF